MINNTSKNPHPEWLMGGNPNAIEDQELKGQQELVNSSQLPSQLNSSSDKSDKDAEEAYTRMGIKVLGHSPGDDLFLDVDLPSGWKIVPTDHAMWSKLIDDAGKVRASIFYKAAFYDRKAGINIE